MIENGMFAQVHYTGTLNDGEVFDSSIDRDPLEFQIGSSMVIPAFEEAIKSMQINDEKEIAIKADDAYGQYNEDMIQKVARTEVEKSLPPQEGMTIHVLLENGSHAPALIKEVTEDSVFLDFNHPLAGKDLNFKLKLMGISEEAVQKKCGCGESCGCDDDSEGCGDKGCCCGE
ncbi:MAG: peptidylprolyl isomerase [Spirochaetes bacterium]|nr:peptidylprolyl isomerase [Spirochaetota bacterium]